MATDPLHCPHHPQGAVDSAEAQLRCVQLEAQAGMAELQSELAGEQRRAQQLATELAAARSRSQGLEAQLASLSGERGDASSRCAAWAAGCWQACAVLRGGC